MLRFSPRSRLFKFGFKFNGIAGSVLEIRCGEGFE